MKTEANEPVKESKSMFAKYYVRYRYIPPYLAFTPLMMISIDHAQVETFANAGEWELSMEICNQLNGMIEPEYIRIESFEKLKESSTKNSLQ